MSKPNEPAFPSYEIRPHGAVTRVQTGLTKREHIAAMAMQGIIRIRNRHDTMNIQDDAGLAVDYADALLRELDQETRVCAVCGLTVDECPAKGEPGWSHD